MRTRFRIWLTTLVFLSACNSKENTFPVSSNEIPLISDSEQPPIPHNFSRNERPKDLYRLTFGDNNPLCAELGFELNSGHPNKADRHLATGLGVFMDNDLSVNWREFTGHVGVGSQYAVVDLFGKDNKTIIVRTFRIKSILTQNLTLYHFTSLPVFQKSANALDNWRKIRASNPEQLSNLSSRSANDEIVKNTRTMLERQEEGFDLQEVEFISNDKTPISYDIKERDYLDVVEIDGRAFILYGFRNQFKNKDHSNDFGVFKMKDTQSMELVCRFKSRYWNN